MTLTKLQPADVARAGELYVAGRTLTDLASELDISPSQLSKRLRQLGTPTRGRPHQACRARSAQIRKLRDERGLTWQEIAVNVDMSSAAARQDYLTHHNDGAQAAQASRR